MSLNYDDYILESLIQQKATFTLKTQGPVRKMAYIILNFIPRLLFD